MSYADEMKNLVGDIKSSRRQRGASIKAIQTRVKEIKSDTQGLLRGFDKELEDLREELAEKAKELQDFLKTAETDRIADFKGLMEGIKDAIGSLQTRVKEIKSDTQGLLKGFDKELEDLREELAEKAKELKHFLSSSESARMADFRDLMRDIGKRISDINNAVNGIRNDTKNLLGEYKVEQKKAAGYWESLGGKVREVEQTISPAVKPVAKPKPKKRAPSKKKKK